MRTDRVIVQCLRTAIVLLGMAHLAFGQGAAGQDPVPAALEARVDEFLEGISLGQTQTAYQKLLAGGPLAEQTEALKTLVEKTKDLKKYGQYRAFEQVAAKRIGTDLVLMKYLYKCDKFPIVWHITFYRAGPVGEAPAEKDNWRVIIVRFDTELEALGGTRE